ncbi:hypothetical protein VPFG_00133 [Vibrio phage nt-1]|uniref:Uncharacterized protein n=1 Tax=Vibrio phage nt-1 TaxID=115992 RepID=R9TIE1_9CAUD|nr:hypothetical protein VPFG_00133 [Vibrio phage nt-1]AGN30135.1 hypothetical protein VPFG_00133 [Vibrio phage nt-1]
MHHFVFQNGEPMNFGNPQEFLDKFNTQFIPELQKRLDNDPRGGKIVYAGSAQSNSVQGIDVQIEDKNGVISTFFVDPFRQTFCPVFFQ